MSLRHLLAAAAALVSLSATAAQAADTAKVAQGELHGATAGAVTSFKTIPFAAPPLAPRSRPFIRSGRMVALRIAGMEKPPAWPPTASGKL